LYENRLIHEHSPYLLQHAHQPVDWYPWGDEAFAKAQREDKPVFLSIGYSTCHWCHVMAHESFEDKEIAEFLRAYFVSVKVDREERPDIDSVYMAACQAMTGSGGWPMSIFLTPEKKPFFAGTYFPKDTQWGMIGFRKLLWVISQKWAHERFELLQSADKVTTALSFEEDTEDGGVDVALLGEAVEQFRMSFDEQYGGFGEVPKFPTPHNLLFLLDQYCKTDHADALRMTEVTLRQMYRGGLFDHIGFGFSRYSTDRAFQIPHFEKMLYDNALLMMAYTRAYDVTQNRFYLEVAEQTAEYVLREMTAPEGGFYSAQDADSEGVEGGYYAFVPSEICQVLSAKTAAAFNRCYGITQRGNFDGRSIPHLVGSIEEARSFTNCLPQLRAYRRQRSRLHVDDKILTSWNALMIAALSQLARLSGKPEHRAAALRSAQFLRSHMQEGNRLQVSCCQGGDGGSGYLDDYAFTVFAFLELYQLVQEPVYLEQAQRLCGRALDDFWDSERGGFYLSGRENERLLMRPKETYDGAIPSGNSVMAYNLVRLSQITSGTQWQDCAERQLKFLSGPAKRIPMAHAFYLLALSCCLTPSKHVTVVLTEGENVSDVLRKLSLDTFVTVLKRPSAEYPLLDGQTTYYTCTGRACRPATNEPPCRRG